MLSMRRSWRDNEPGVAVLNQPQAAHTHAARSIGHFFLLMNSRFRPFPLLAGFCLVSVFAVGGGAEAKVGEPAGVVTSSGPVWARHTIDDTSRGADGVKLGDLN